MDRAKNIVENIKARRVTAAETLQSCLDAINDRDPEIRAFATLNKKRAVEQVNEFLYSRS